MVQEVASIDWTVAALTAEHYLLIFNLEKPKGLQGKAWPSEVSQIGS